MDAKTVGRWKEQWTMYSTHVRMMLGRAIDIDQVPGQFLSFPGQGGFISRQFTNGSNVSFDILWKYELNIEIMAERMFST